MTRPKLDTAQKVLDWYSTGLYDRSPKVCRTAAFLARCVRIAEIVEACAREEYSHVDSYDAGIILAEAEAEKSK